MSRDKTAKPVPPKKTPAKKPATKSKASNKPAPKVSTNGKNPELIHAQYQRFVDEYIIDYNGTRAAIAAGYSERSAASTSSTLLRNPKVQEFLRDARQRQQDRTEITADRVLREAWNQVTADARELTALVYHACRHCHGVNHEYQWRDHDEYMEAVSQREDSIRNRREDDRSPLPPEISLAGGFGYTRKLDPHHGCPKCDGEGHMRIELGDTRKLSQSALSLYAGVKQTKFGIEILTHSKDAAMEKLFKHLGLYEKDNSQQADALTTLLHGIATANGNGFNPVARDPEHDEE